MDGRSRRPHRDGHPAPRRTTDGQNTDACLRPGGPHVATSVFDVEDPITPESDDVAPWPVEIAAEEGLEATFSVTGANPHAGRPGTET